MIERLCSSCDKPVKGILYKGMCRSCYDKNRQTTMVAIPKKLQKDFEEYMNFSNENPAKCIIELVEVGLKVHKHGKRQLVINLKELGD